MHVAYSAEDAFDWNGRSKRVSLPSLHRTMKRYHIANTPAFPSNTICNGGQSNMVCEEERSTWERPNALILIGRSCADHCYLVLTRHNCNDHVDMFRIISHWRGHRASIVSSVWREHSGRRSVRSCSGPVVQRTEGAVPSVNGGRRKTEGMCVSLCYFYGRLYRVSIETYLDRGRQFCIDRCWTHGIS